MEERAYRTEAVVSDGGAVSLRGLPFRPGEPVEVIVLARRGAAAAAPADPAGARGSDPLRGSVLRYDDPTAPVAADDWAAGAPGA